MSGVAVVFGPFPRKTQGPFLETAWGELHRYLYFEKASGISLGALLPTWD